MRSSIARGASSMSALWVGLGLSWALSLVWDLGSALPSCFAAGWVDAAGPRSKPSITAEGARIVPPLAVAAPPQPWQPVAGFSLNTSAPLRSLTSSMNHGVTRKPPLTNTE